MRGWVRLGAVGIAGWVCGHAAFAVEEIRQPPSVLPLPVVSHASMFEPGSFALDPQAAIPEGDIAPGATWSVRDIRTPVYPRARSRDLLRFVRANSDTVRFGETPPVSQQAPQSEAPSEAQGGTNTSDPTALGIPGLTEIQAVPAEQDPSRAGSAPSTTYPASQDPTPACDAEGQCPFSSWPMTGSSTIEANESCTRPSS